MSLVNAEEGEGLVEQISKEFDSLAFQSLLSSEKSGGLLYYILKINKELNLSWLSALVNKTNQMSNLIPFKY